MICVSVIALRTVGGITIGPIIWLIISEIVQPQRVSICGASNWISLGLVNVAFPVIVDANAEKNPWFAYFFFALVATTATLINYFAVIKTANKT